MQSSTVKDNSFQQQQQQLAHFTNQSIISDSQLHNQDTVRKAIRRYQSKISQMVRIIQKQKKQNDSLKAQLKTLNQSLNNVIDRLSHKNITANNGSSQSAKDDLIKKQLQNQIKKNTLLQKQTNQLRLKLKTYDLPRINQLQNQLKQKAVKIEQLSQQIRMYEKIQKQQKNTDVYKRQQQNKNQFVLLNQEIQFLKNKLAIAKKQEQNLQKKIKKQHEQIMNLDSNLGGSGANKNAAHNNSGSSNSKPVQIAASIADNNNTKQQVTQLRQKCQNLQITKKATEKHLRHQIQNLKTRNTVLQKQGQQLQSKLDRKQKQAHILMAKMRQTQRKNYNTLEPMQKLKVSEEFGTTGLFDQRKQFKGLVHIQGNYRKFDDTEGLSLQKNYRIKSFVFTWYEQHILSLDTVYELRDGTQREISSFKIQHKYQNIKHAGFNLAEFEYLKQVEVYCGKFIEFMRFETSRDRTVQIGNQKNKAKCKKFTFDIRTHEKPIAFLGAIDNKKIIGGESTKQLLISFGLQIKKKDVLGKSRFNPGRTSSLNKYASKSALDKKRKNDDKNVIDEEQS